MGRIKTFGGSWNLPGVADLPDPFIGLYVKHDGTNDLVNTAPPPQTVAQARAPRVVQQALVAVSPAAVDSSTKAESVL